MSTTIEKLDQADEVLTNILPTTSGAESAIKAARAAIDAARYAEREALAANEATRND